MVYTTLPSNYLVCSFLWSLMKNRNTWNVVTSFPEAAEIMFRSECDDDDDVVLVGLS